MDQQIDIGKIWRGWKTVEVIGTGSYGKVYKIIKEDFGHTYVSALKVITIPANQAEVVSVRNEGLDEKSVSGYFYSMVEDIVKECALMSKLQGNSNIVSYDDHAVIAHEDGIGWDIYIRMEYLTPLCEHANKNPLQKRDVVRLGIDICKALETCRNYNIIHRDIKPENIFLSDFGQYKLGDFGIARQLERTSAGLTKTGTLTYMAPEIFLGREYNVSVDLYSLGIVLYRFLNDLRSPFLPPAPVPLTVSEREKATQRRLGGESMPPPCMADDALAKVVLKACAYDPKQRYHDATEMKKDLEAVLLTYPMSSVDLEVQKEEPERGHEEIENLPGEKKLNPDGTVVLLFPEKEEEGIGTKSEKKPDTVFEEPSDGGQEGVHGEDAPPVTGEYAKPKNKLVIALPAGVAVFVFFLIVILFLNQMQEKREQMLAVNVLGAEHLAMDIEMPGIVEVRAPNLVGLTKEKAEAALEEANLIAKEGESKYSDKVQAGLVMSQKPKKNKMVPEGTEVRYVISLGPKQTEVPLVEGLFLEKAQGILEGSGFRFSYEEAFDEENEAGIVISQSIKAGSMADPDTEVHLVVSKGAEPQEEEETLPKTENPKNQENSGMSEQPPEEPAVPEPQPAVPEPQPVVPEPQPEVPEPDFNWMD